MYSEGDIQIKDDAIIESTVQNQCTTDNTGNMDLYMCIPTDFDDNKLDRAYLLDFYNRQYGLYPSDNGYA